MMVAEASWRLSAMDIAHGNGKATVALKSGLEYEGTVDEKLSAHEVLFLRTQTGWVAIDWEEIAAMEGSR